MVTRKRSLNIDDIEVANLVNMNNLDYTKKFDFGIGYQANVVVKVKCFGV